MKKYNYLPKEDTLGIDVCPSCGLKVEGHPCVCPSCGCDPFQDSTLSELGIYKDEESYIHIAWKIEHKDDEEKRREQ